MDSPMRRTGAALVLCAASGLGAAQNVIVNGDFESPVGGGQSSPLGSLAGWSAATDVVSIVTATTAGVSGQTNQQVLDLGGAFGYSMGPKAKVYQDVFLNAGLHSFSFKWGQPLAEALNSNYLFFHVYNSNQTLDAGSLTPFPATQPMWTYSSTFTVLTAGVFRVQFQETGGISNPGHGTLVDDVQLNAVPEPVTMMTLAVGVGGFAARRRGRK